MRTATVVEGSLASQMFFVIAAEDSTVQWRSPHGHQLTEDRLDVEN